MSPVISALLAFMAALFRSRASLRLEHLALRHQLAVYQRSVPRPRLRPTDRLLWVWVAGRAHLSHASGAGYGRTCPAPSGTTRSWTCVGRPGSGRLASSLRAESGVMTWALICRCTIATGFRDPQAVRRPRASDQPLHRGCPAVRGRGGGSTMPSSTSCQRGATEGWP
jgi:hypothetical protein